MVQTIHKHIHVSIFNACLNIFIVTLSLHIGLFTRNTKYDETGADWICVCDSQQPTNKIFMSYILNQTQTSQLEQLLCSVMLTNWNNHSRTKRKRWRERGRENMEQKSVSVGGEGEKPTESKWDVKKRLQAHRDDARERLKEREGRERA